MKAALAGKYQDAIIYIFAIVYLFAGINYGINVYDESLALCGADAVSKGLAPYIDFSTIYAPGQFYFLAGLMPAFGWEMIGGRIISTILMFLSAFILHRISKKYFDKTLSGMIFLTAVIWASYTPLYSRAVPSAIFLSFLVFYMIDNFLREKNINLIILAGLLSAFVLFFRQDFGVYLFLSIVAGLLIFRFVYGFKNLHPVVIIIYILLFFITLYFLFVSLLPVPTGVVYENIVSNPMKYVSGYRDLPFPDPVSPFISSGGIGSIITGFWKGIVFYIPLIVIIAALFGSLRKKSKFIKSHGFLIFFAIYSLLLLNQARVRSDMEHLFPSLIFSLPLFVLALGNLKVKYGKILYYFVFIVLAALPLAKKAKQINDCYLNKNSIEISGYRLDGLKLNKELAVNYKNTLDFINTNTKKGETIFSGCASHDRILLNDLSLYYNSERKSPSKYYELHPGIATTGKVQQEMIDGIKKSKTKLIVLIKSGVSTESNLSSVSSGVFLLDNYIKQNFVKKEEYGDYLIYMKTGN